MRTDTTWHASVCALLPNDSATTARRRKMKCTAHTFGKTSTMQYNTTGNFLQKNAFKTYLTYILSMKYADMTILERQKMYYNQEYAGYEVFTEI